MPRTYLIFGDIEGKLDVLRVEPRSGARPLQEADTYNLGQVLEQIKRATARTPASSRGQYLQVTKRAPRGAYALQLRK